MLGVYFIGGGQFILHTLLFNIHIFRFKLDAGLQVDIDFNTESKFSCSRNSLFLPLSSVSPQNQPNP